MSLAHQLPHIYGRDSTACLLHVNSGATLTPAGPDDDLCTKCRATGLSGPWLVISDRSSASPEANTSIASVVAPQGSTSDVLDGFLS